MRKLADYGTDDHPDGDPDRTPVAWTVASIDDCDGCEALRVELTVEEMDRPGTGLAAHLAPDSARRLRTAIAGALRDLGEDPGP